MSPGLRRYSEIRRHLAAANSSFFLTVRYGQRKWRSASRRSCYWWPWRSLVTWASLQGWRHVATGSRHAPSMRSSVGRHVSMCLLSTWQSAIWLSAVSPWQPKCCSSYSRRAGYSDRSPVKYCSTYRYSYIIISARFRTTRTLLFVLISVIWLDSHCTLYMHFFMTS